MPSLRDYQVDAVDGVFREWDRGVRSTIVVMPTGTGKTSVAGAIVDRLPEGARALWLVHRDLLVRQTCDEFKQWTRKSIDIEIGQHGIGKTHAGRADVIIAGVQSMKGRVKKYGKDAFDYVFCDEAHRFANNSWQKVFDWFDSKFRYGTTATPCRSDEFSMGNVYDSTAYEMQMLTAIDSGWLVPLRTRTVRLRDVDMDSFRASKDGDYSKSAVSAAYCADPVVARVVDEMIRTCDGRSGIVFCADVAQVKAVHARFQQVGATSMIIVGDTPDHIRKLREADFRSGRVQFAIGCDVFTEGWSVNQVAVVGLARPTKSLSKVIQMVGRGTRPIIPPDAFPTAEARREFIREGEKPFVTIIDFVGASKRFDFRMSLDVLGGNYSSEEREEVIRLLEDVSSDVDLREVAEKARENVAKRPKTEKVSIADRAAERRWIHSYKPCPFTVFGLDKAAAAVKVSKEDTYGQNMTKARQYLVDNKVDELTIQRLSGHEIVYFARYLWHRNEKHGHAGYKLSVLLWKCGFDVRQMSRRDAFRLIGEVKAQPNDWSRPEKYGPNVRFLDYTGRSRGGS